MWSELISAVIGALAMLLVAWFKPEWVLGPILNWLTKKLEKKEANVVSNALGLMLLVAGLYALNKIPDNPEAQEILNNIAAEVQRLKKALEKNE